MHLKNYITVTSKEEQLYNLIFPEITNQLNIIKEYCQSINQQSPYDIRYFLKVYLGVIIIKYDRIYKSFASQFYYNYLVDQPLLLKVKNIFKPYVINYPNFLIAEAFEFLA